MNAKHRSLAALLCGALAAGLVGCAGKPQPQSAPPAASGQGAAMGRWVETQVDLSALPEGSFFIGAAAEGGVTRFFVSEGSALYDCVQEQDTLRVKETFTGLPGSPMAATARGESLAYALRGEDGSITLVLRQGGQDQQFTPEWLKGALVQNLRFMGSSALFVDYMPAVQIEGTDEGGLAVQGHAFAVLDTASGQVQGRADMPEGWYGAMAANETQVFCISQDGLLEVYDRQGSLDASQGVQLSIKGYFTVAAADQGGICFADSAGIYRAASGGGLVETLLEGGGRAFNQDSLYLTRLAAAGSGEILLAARDISDSEAADRRGVLLRYYFDETLPAENAKKLVVWSLEDQPTVRAAVLAYSRSHTDVTVNYQPALGPGAGKAERADALTALNTALLAGAGPDVLILDGVPWQRYASQGLLAELTGVGTQGLQENLVEPLKLEGALWAVPARFTLPVLLGQEQDLTGLATPQAVVDKVLAMAPRPAGMNGGSEEYYRLRTGQERYALSFISQSVLFDYLYPLYTPALVEGGALNEEALAQMYRQMQAVSGAYGLPAENTPNGVGVDVWSVGDELYEFGLGAALGWCDLADLDMLSFNNAYALVEGGDELGKEFTAKVRAAARPGMAQGLFTPVCLAAVNAGSGQKEEAQSFVQALLGDEVQKSPLGDGLPVQKEALGELLREASGAGAPLAAQDLAALIQACATPIQRDWQVEEALRGPALAVCGGEKTVEEAVAAAKQALSLYLAEQK